MQIKQVNINKKDLSIYKKLIEAKKFVSTQIRRPYMITIIVLTFIILAVGMFFMNVFYEKSTYFDANYNTHVTHFRTWAKVVADDKSILLYWYPPIVKLFVAISMPVAGYAIQITTQNRLSSPSTLGYIPVSILAYVAMLMIDQGKSWLVYVFGFIFSSFIILVNYILQRQKSSNRSFKPVLIGFAISATITAVGLVIAVSRPNILNRVTIWTGELPNVYEWLKLYISMPLILICLFAFLVLSPKLKIMQRDFALAKSLGIKVNLIFWVVTVLTAIVTIATVNITSPMILLGLIIPNIVRATFNKHEPLFVFFVSIVFSLALLEVSLFLSLNYRFGPNFLMAIVSAFVLIFIMRKHG